MTNGKTCEAHGLPDIGPICGDYHAMRAIETLRFRGYTPEQVEHAMRVAYIVTPAKPTEVR